MSAPAPKRVAKIQRSIAIVAAASPVPAAEQSAAFRNAPMDTGDIAELAYSYWEARGYQGGSPEEDWLRAEQQLRDEG